MKNENKNYYNLKILTKIVENTNLRRQIAQISMNDAYTPQVVKKSHIRMSQMLSKPPNFSGIAEIIHFIYIRIFSIEKTIQCRIITIQCKIMTIS